LWAALGLGGLAGAFIDRPVSLYGPVATFLACMTTLLVGSTALLAPTLEGRLWCLMGAACFGAAYMAMSSVLLLWGRLLDPQRGAAITAWLFIALAVGQAIGARILGTVLT
jgi:hypothetical protein